MVSEACLRGPHSSKAAQLCCRLPHTTKRKASQWSASLAAYCTPLSSITSWDAESLRKVHSRLTVLLLPHTRRGFCEAAAFHVFATEAPPFLDLCPACLKDMARECHLRRRPPGSHAANLNSSPYWAVQQLSATDYKDQCSPTSSKNFRNRGLKKSTHNRQSRRFIHILPKVQIVHGIHVVDMD